jgi:hypothetical protein
VDLDAEIVKCDKKLDVARMNAEKIRKVESQPEYETTVPENVRVANAEKVRLLCLAQLFLLHAECISNSCSLRHTRRRSRTWRPQKNYSRI